MATVTRTHTFGLARPDNLTTKHRVALARHRRGLEENESELTSERPYNWIKHDAVL